MCLLGAGRGWAWHECQHISRIKEGGGTAHGHGGFELKPCHQSEGTSPRHGSRDPPIGPWGGSSLIRHFGSESSAYWHHPCTESRHLGSTTSLLSDVTWVQGGSLLVGGSIKTWMS
ncbi:hypothetical protein MHYP_G00159730 [Metynnis hypsauchen]